MCYSNRWDYPIYDYEQEQRDARNERRRELYRQKKEAARVQALLEADRQTFQAIAASVTDTPKVTMAGKAPRSLAHAV